MNVVSDKLNCRASACMTSVSKPEPSSKTQSGLPLNAPRCWVNTLRCETGESPYWREFRTTRRQWQLWPYHDNRRGRDYRHARPVIATVPTHRGDHATRQERLPLNIMKSIIYWSYA